MTPKSKNAPSTKQMDQKNKNQNTRNRKETLVLAMIIVIASLWNVCVSMVGKANIERSKRNVAMDARFPQVSDSCIPKSDTSLCPLALRDR